jgi:four helix bundle protein
VNYEDWLKSVPQEIADDALWTVKAYRYALFLSDLCWFDVTKLMQDKRTLDLSDQLYRAAGSISANIAEGYSRSTGKDRARFYEYALGSARESRDWYYKARHVLGENVAQHRSGLLTEIIRLLITMVPQQRRSGTIREERVEYTIDADRFLSNAPLP